MRQEALRDPSPIPEDVFDKAVENMYSRFGGKEKFAESGMTEEDIRREAEDLYAAMDWLIQRQPKIEQALAKRHLSDGTLVLYEVSSSYLEGRRCRLARSGHSRDGKKGSLQIVYGLLCSAAGCPVAMQVYEGGTADPRTLADQIHKARLDGVYVLRTSAPAEVLDAADTVRAYKGLAAVERAFRCLKTVDLHVRPVYHHLEARVRAHVLLCMLAYYVEHHMRQALVPLLFAEDDPAGAALRRGSPV